MNETRKRLLWRATHRGIREMDLILGGFVRARIEQLNEEDLASLEQIVEIPDQQLLSWAMKQEQVPEWLRSRLLLDILQHQP